MGYKHKQKDEREMRWKIKSRAELVENRNE